MKKNISKNIHCFVSGKVQGVFYRANTQRKAVELGLTGWARNLPDGRVEVMAFGPPEQIELFTAWLWEGPSAARVDDVSITDIDHQEFANFSVR
jgi:acylphosphatase